MALPTAETSPAADRSPSWHRLAAYVATVVLIAGWVAGRSQGTAHLPAVWPATAASGGWLLVLGLPLLWPGRVGRWWWWPALAVLAVGGAWWLASTELFVAQGRVLTGEELLRRWSRPIDREFLLELIRVPQAWLALAAPPAIAIVLARLFHGRRGLAGLGGGAALLLVALGGIRLTGALLGYDRSFHGQVRPTLAPWHPAHRAEIPLPTADLPAAARIRATAAAPWWAPGAPPPLAGLAGRYPQRSVLVVSLESHRLCDVAPWGVGAWTHAPTSPHLAALAGRALAFPGMVQSGSCTHQSAWAMLSGLPPLADATADLVGPELGAVGRVPAFQALGYRCRWLQATDTSFADLDRMLRLLRIDDRIGEAETANLDRSRWNLWGMPDDQLLEVACRRLEGSGSQGELLIAFTISNHQPFDLPPGFSRDHPGGMAFADHAVGRLVAWWDAQPEDRRPVLWIQADHGQGAGLAGHPRGWACAEAFRVPGLLLLPDGAAAGQAWDGPVCHQDVLDLLYLLVAPPAAAAGPWLAQHRVVAPAVAAGARLVVARDGWLGDAAPAGITARGLWATEPGLAEPLRATLQAAWDDLERQRGVLWP